MESGAVGLDDHALLRPDEVGADHRPSIREIDPPVDEWVRQAEPAGDREHRLLELALGGRAADVVLVEQRPDTFCARAAPVALDLILDLGEVEHLEDLSLVEGALERSAVDDLRQVEQRPGDRRARDAVDGRDVGWRERGRAMDVDAGAFAM